MATKKRVVSKEDVEYGYVQACLQVAEIDWKEDQNTPEFSEEEDPSHSKQRKVNKVSLLILLQFHNIHMKQTMKVFFLYIYMCVSWEKFLYK